ncbi:hypothetical protein PDJAM_G00201090 [Pangasius djambal]|uniref:Uncharacterized protein n=1 Tax=Pangasius djambal TaxID=1691987 RepID=A0ACC5Y777_9TELE|nr:hypothetical protein [Pangasius djambal]
MEAQFVGESDGLIFWLARPQDYDEVMAISQYIYQGNDYLPHRYHTWMNEHERVVIISRRNGKMRVTDRYIKQVYPSVTTKRLTRSDNPGPEKLSKFIFLACRAILSFFGEAESFKGFVSGLKTKLESTEKSGGPSNNNQKVFVLKDSHQLKAILLDPDLSLRLQLPGGAIIQDWQPLKPVESNLEILERRNLTWLVDCFIDKPMFMSFHTPPYPVPFNGGSLRFNIDMFGTDVSIAKKALIAHLEQVIEEIHGTVVVHVYMPQTFWEAMRHFCEGDEGVKQWMYYWEQLFLEKEMP